MRFVLRAERAGDDGVQSVLTDPAAVVDAVLALVREGGWTVGVGAGPRGR